MNYLEKVIEFHEDEVLTFQEQETGKIYVAVTMICNSLGMTENQVNSQRQKIQTDETLKLGAKKLAVTIHGQVREQLFIELEFLSGWLFKINPARFDTKLKEKLLEYQLHCKDILADAFFGKREKLKDKLNFNEYNNESRERFIEAESIENKIRELCIILINEYEMIEWRTEQSRKRAEKLYKSLEGEKFIQDGKETTFKDINKINPHKYEEIKERLK